MAKQGKCPNFGGCLLADEGRIQELSEGVEFKCEQCGTELTEISNKNNKKTKGSKPPKGRKEELVSEGSAKTRSGGRRPLSPAVKITLIVVIGSMLIGGIGVGGYVAYKAWQIARLVSMVKTAVELADASSAEEALTKLKKLGELADVCPWCIEQVGNLLKTAFDKMMTEDNIEQAKQIWAKIQNLGLQGICLDCEERLKKKEDTGPYRKQFEFLPIEPFTEEFTPYLKRFLGYIGSGVTIEQPFSIMGGEVTVGQFREYAKSLSEEKRAALGDWWEKDIKTNEPYPDNRPVENVSWQEANDYAAWLSEKTGWTLRLPTVTEWAGACVKYPDPQPVLGRNDKDKPDEVVVLVLRNQRQIDHLLGNLREWSADSCGNGQYSLLGENYMTAPDDPSVIGTGNCAKDAKWAGIGFRLVKVTE